MAIVRWDPFRDLLNLQDEVNSLFRRSFFRGAEVRRQWRPRPLGLPRSTCTRVTTSSPSRWNCPDLDAKGYRHQPRGRYPAHQGRA